MLSTSEIEELFEHSFEKIRKGLPYWNIVKFNEGLHQICLGISDVIGNKHPKNIKLVRNYLKNEIKFLESYNPSNQLGKISREMILGDLRAIYSVFEKTRKKINRMPPNFRIPIQADIYESVRNYIVDMILSRNIRGYNQMQEELTNMTCDAYRDKETVRFRKLCAYSNALIFFKSTIILSD